MSGVKHTPCKWSVSVKNGVVSVQATDEIGQPLDVCAMSNFDMEANARLIAAAPDLLEALQLVRMSFGWQVLSDETKSVIDAAITRATGDRPEKGGAL